MKPIQTPADFSNDFKKPKKKYIYIFLKISQRKGNKRNQSMNHLASVHFHLSVSTTEQVHHQRGILAPFHHSPPAPAPLLRGSPCWSSSSSPPPPHPPPHLRRSSPQRASTPSRPCTNLGASLSLSLFLL